MPHLPKPITDKLAALDKLIDENPLTIPVEKAADFLEMNGESLRTAMEQGRCPFAIAWQKNLRGYRAFKIPTVTFYLWYTNCRGVPDWNVTHEMIL